MPPVLVRSAAAAIANGRGMRRGVPPISNVLDVLKSLPSPGILDDVMEDAKDALIAAGVPAMLDALKLAVTHCPCTVKERDSGHRVDCWLADGTVQELIARAEGGQPA